MADKKKSKKSEKVEAPEPVETKKAEPEAPVRGDRGEVGVATAALKLRQLWHEAHFTRKDVGDKNNPVKRIWVPNHGAPSLKRFARELLKAGDAVAKEWFANKRGAKNQKRTEKNQARVNLEKQASKAARRKKSQGKGGGGAKTEASPAK